MFFHRNTQTTDDIDTQIADLKAQSIRAKEDRERLLRKIRDTQTEASTSSVPAWKALFFGKSVFTASVRLISRWMHTRLIKPSCTEPEYVPKSFHHIGSHPGNDIFRLLSVSPCQRHNSFESIEVLTLALPALPH